MPKLSKLHFRPVARLELGINEASDVTPLPGGKMLVVGDRSQDPLLIGKNGKTTRLQMEGAPKGDSQFEATAHNAKRSLLFISREEAREILRYRYSGKKGTTPELDKVLPVHWKAGRENKGVEAMAFLKAKFSPTGKPQLVIGLEAQRLAFLDENGEGEPIKIKVHRKVLETLPDFAAMAVDPVSGHLFIASQESATVAEVRFALRKDGSLIARLVGTMPLLDRGGRPLKRVEGLTFNSGGDLCALLEDKSQLVRFERR